MFNLEIFGILILLSLLVNNLFMEEEYTWGFINSEIRFWIRILVVVLYLIVLIVNIGYKIRLNILFVLLYYLIRVSDLVVFFYLYEMVFILIIFAIILLGYSYERLLASFIMMFYSFLFSRPVLIIVLLLDSTFLIKNWLSYSVLISYFLVGSFIVKFPIFGFHYWLPIAHVEASTVGRMILAGLLLKLGSIGLVYVVMYLGFMVKLHWVGLGVVILIVIILRLRDLKIIIAYSSVAHISIVFYVLILGVSVGKKGAICMIFYHGFISPLIFWIVGILAWWKTRSLIVVKLMSFSFLFLLSLFVLLIINIGFPPFLGFMREVLLLKRLVSNSLILYVMIWGVLFRCYYNIYLFWCFNRFIGLVYKMNFFRMDLFLFVLFVVFINFY